MTKAQSSYNSIVQIHEKSGMSHSLFKMLRYILQKLHFHTIGFVYCVQRKNKTMISLETLFFDECFHKNFNPFSLSL